MVTMEDIEEKFDRTLFPFLGFRWIWLAIILYSLPSLLVQIFLHPQSTAFLTLSAGRPWGIITSSFVHNNLTHFSSNFFMFLTLVFLFLVANLFNDIDKREHVGKVFFGSVFIAGTVVSSSLELMYRNLAGETVRIMGSSGIVYAALGCLLTSALINLLFYHARRVEKYFKNESGITKPGEGFLFFSSLAINISILLVSIYWVFTPDFLGEGVHIGKVAHGSGFLAGFLISLFSLLKFSELKESFESIL